MALGSDQNLNIVVRLKDEASKQLGDFQDRVEKMGPAFTKMAAIGTAAFAGIAAVVGSSVSKYVEAGDAINDMAVKTGFSAKALSELKYAAELSGTSIDSLEIATKSMSRFIEASKDSANSAAKAYQDNLASATTSLTEKQKALTKQIEMANAKITDMDKKGGKNGETLKVMRRNVEDLKRELAELGTTAKVGAPEMSSYEITLQKLGLKMKDLANLTPEETFNTLAMSIASLSDPMQRSSIAMDVFGKAGTDLLPMLSEGPEGIKKMREEAQRLGITFDSKTAKAAADFDDAMKKLQGTITGAQNAIAQSMLPILQQLVEKVQPVILAISDWIKAHPQLTEVIIIGAAAVSALVAGIGFLGLALPAIITGFTLLMGPIGLVIGAVTLLSAGIILLVKNWDYVREQMKLTWDGIKIMFTDGVNVLIGLAEAWANMWVKAANTIIGALNKIKFSMPSWVPGVGGKSFGINIPLAEEVKLPRFEHGGMVPGARGSAVPIMAHGGEQIIPAGNVGSSGDVYVNLTLNYPQFRDQEDISVVRSQVERAFRDVIRVNKLQSA